MKILAALLLAITAVACSDNGGGGNGDPPPIYTLPDTGNESDAGEDVVECVAETDTEMCTRLGYVCGSLTADDNCGTERTIESCGDAATVCGQFETCGGSGTPGQCGCTAETNEELCTRNNVECGDFTGTDNCGAERTVSCGDEGVVCTIYETCGGGGTPGQCGCTPESDAEMCTRTGSECGELIANDNCGAERTIASCGDETTVCATLETCGGGGTPGQCGCTPETDVELCDAAAIECGPLTVTDSCGTERIIASCGDEATVCAPFETCGGAGPVGVCGCTPETDAAMCLRLGYECGELVGTDNCGQARTVASCGDEATVCAELESCGGGGTPGQCGCTPESDTQLCQIKNYACGPLETVDSCGVTRQIAECGPECAPPTTCGGAGVPGQCGCTSDPDDIVCANNNLDCGLVELTDNCNVKRDRDCGDPTLVCTLYDTCGGGGTANVCGCTPTTCEADGILCGTFDDGCGGTLNCDSFCVDDVVAGAAHVCAVGSGRLKCWGKNDKGQLGDGTTTQQNNPVNVLNLPANVVGVAPGGGHTCALTTAGAVHCWGYNNEGQLGVGTTVDNKLPGSPAVIAGATQVVAGENHTCALINGGVKCWGSNTYGKIGSAALNLGTNVAVAYPVDGLQTGVAELSAGQHHTCALKVDGTVWCWGRNQYGQIGNLELNPELPIPAYGFNNTLSLDTNTEVRAPLQVVGVPAATQISVGRDFSCAIDGVGEVWCWGAMTRVPTTTTTCPVATGYSNANGPIFVNGQTCSLMPLDVTAVPVTKYSRTVKIGANCGGAEDAPCDAPNFCNANGKCESYEYPITTVFTDRAALDPVNMGHALPGIELGAGANHLCTIVEQPDLLMTNVQCMGLNTFGQLGDGTNNNWTFPVSVFYDINDKVVRAQLVTGGDNFTCALIEDANVQCWGSNQFGQIGNTALIRDETYRPFDVKLDNQP